MGVQHVGTQHACQWDSLHAALVTGPALQNMPYLQYFDYLAGLGQQGIYYNKTVGPQVYTHPSWGRQWQHHGNMRVVHGAR